MFSIFTVIEQDSHGDPTGEADKDALRLESDRRLMVQFLGSVITSDGGLLAYRELEGVLSLTETDGEILADARTGKNGRHQLVGLLRQSVFGPSSGIPRTHKAAQRLGYETSSVSFDDLSEQHKANFMQFAGWGTGAVCGVGPSTDPKYWWVCYKNENGECTWVKVPRGPPPQAHDRSLYRSGGVLGTVWRRRPGSDTAHICWPLGQVAPCARARLCIGAFLTIAGRTRRVSTYGPTCRVTRPLRRPAMPGSAFYTKDRFGEIRLSGCMYSD
jgi:hypothetical protein